MQFMQKVRHKSHAFGVHYIDLRPDGGKDVIADIKREDGIEKVYVECKRYKSTKLKPETVRAFLYVLNNEKATRGVIFCTGYVSEQLKKIDDRVQIWTLDEINFLLNAHMGWNWKERLKILLDNHRRNDCSSKEKAGLARL